MSKGPEKKEAGRDAYKQKMKEKKERKKAKKLRGRRALMKEYNESRKTTKDKKRKRDAEEVGDDSGEQAYKKRKAMSEGTATTAETSNMVVHGDAGDDFISFGDEPVKSVKSVNAIEPKGKKIVARGKSGRPGKPSKYGPNANKHNREDKYRREKLKRASARIAKGQPKAGDEEFVQEETARVAASGANMVQENPYRRPEGESAVKKTTKKKKVSPRELLRQERKEKRQNRSKENALKNRAAAAEELEELGWEDDGEEGGVDILEGAAEPEEAGMLDGADGEYEEQPNQKFYGLVTDDEQAYFANVSQKITANDFESDEDRSIFVEAIYREAAGKELKLASSQSCSRCLEKLIPLSNAQQLQQLFNEFLTDLTYLVQHRFGSHCCETLFSYSARMISAGGKARGAGKSLEDLILEVIDVLQPNMGFLLTDRFASHVLRTLILILSGEPLDDPKNSAILGGRKETTKDHKGREQDGVVLARKVPDTFRPAMEKLISSATSSLDTAYLRSLATSPIGSPFLQLLLRLELSGGKAKDLGEDSMFKRLLPDNSLDADTESAKFVSFMTYDPTASHVVEVLVTETEGKTFKKLFRNVFKPKLGSMVKNDIATYVANKILIRLGKDDLLDARDTIVPEVPVLVKRRWIGSLKVLVERCVKREVDLQPVADALSAAYEHQEILAKMTNVGFSAQPEQKKEKEDTPAGKARSGADQHGCLLAQALLQSPQTAPLVQDSLLAMPSAALIELCSIPTSSRLVQTALDPSTPTSTAGFRKQLVARFYGHMTTIATSPAGSHVADVLWSATHGNMQYMKEKLAHELQDNETTIREDRYGRTVWRNWSMDLYGRRMAEWHALSKTPSNEIGTTATNGEEDNTTEKTSIQLARERHAAKKAYGGVLRTDGNGKSDRNGIDSKLPEE